MVSRHSHPTFDAAREEVAYCLAKKLGWLKPGQRLIPGCLDKNGNAVAHVIEPEIYYCLRKKAEPAPTPAEKEFTVIVVSSNTDAFGHRNHICLAGDGEGVQFTASAYDCRRQYKRGESIRMSEVRASGREVVMGAPLPKVPPSRAQEIIEEALEGGAE